MEAAAGPSVRTQGETHPAAGGGWIAVNIVELPRYHTFDSH
jgi:hypothetical protein